MQVIRNTLDFKFDRKTALSIGKFDGVHRGHMLIIDKLWEYHEKGYHTAVVTFDVSPLRALTGDVQPLLTTQEEKELVLEAAGVDTLVVLPFTPEVSSIEAETFVRDILIDKMNMKAIAVGEDCTFGHKALGRVDLLEKMSKDCGFELNVFPKKTYEGHVISSSYIRTLVSEGRVGEVRRMSRQPYFIYGNVAENGGLSQKFGLPYCLMNVPVDKVIPAAGLYYSKVMKYDVFYPSLSFVSANRRLVGTYLFEADRILGYDDISVGLFEFVREPLPAVDPFHLTEKELRDQFKNEIIGAMKWHKENIYIPEDVC